uniref:Uncharacterized protein n=1 Tax=Helianthus annuus TaxID=4232 RepID=A0A251UQY9_HELAN
MILVSNETSDLFLQFPTPKTGQQPTYFVNSRKEEARAHNLLIHKDIQLSSWMDVGDVNAGTLNKSNL